MKDNTKTLQKEPQDKICLLILDLKPRRSQVKEKHYVGRDYRA